MSKITQLKLVADFTPPPDPPEANAVLTLKDVSYSVNENDWLYFQINRTVRTDQVLDVDWSFQNVSMSIMSGTIRFNVGIAGFQQGIQALEVNTNELGTLTLSNPRYVSGPVSDPILGTPFQASVTIFDTASAPTEQELRDLGFLLPEDYGAIGNGVANDEPALNLAMKDSHDTSQTVCLQAGKIYQVEDTVRIGEWFCSTDSSSFPSVIGLGHGDNRPLIRLANGASNFGSSGSPRPVVCFRNFDCTVSSYYASDDAAKTWPSDPLGEFGKSANYFESSFENVRIDCGNNAGAFGLYMPLAQDTFASDIEIDCSNALGGWWGFPGRNDAATNIKIIGGVWQIRSGSRGSSPAGEGSAGTMITGLELVGDSRTTEPIRQTDFIPMTIVGFDITRTTSGPFVTTESNSKSINAVIMIDGIVRSAGGRVFNNASAKNCYLRNVYITGTDDLVQSGGLGSHSAVGTWKRINEYAYNEELTFSSSAGQYPNYSLINGNETGPGEHEPVVDIDASVSAPTANYIARHTINRWRFGDGPYVNIEDHGAVSGPALSANGAYDNGDNYDNTTPDALSAIQAAITAADVAGHNIVVVPRGFYYVGSPGVQMLPNTKLIGIHHLSSRIGCHGSWQPTSQVWVVTSADDANGTAHVSGLAIATRQIDGAAATLTTPAPYDHFSWLHWRTGKNSSTVRFGMGARQFVGRIQPSGLFPATNRKTWHEFSGNGGGKHYSCMSPGRFTNHPDFRAVRATGTSQPLHLYGNNTEMSKVRNSTPADINVEIQNSANIRIYASKREGHGATMMVNDSTNICWYGLGRQVEGDDGARFTVGIFGTSDDIIIAPCTFDEDDASITSAAPMLEENLDTEPAVQIDWPFGVSYYKRGNPNDSLVEIN